MATDADFRLASELQREVDYYSQPGAHEASTTEERDWINTARLAIEFLQSTDTTDQQRAAARTALERTPPVHP